MCLDLRKIYAIQLCQTDQIDARMRSLNANILAEDENITASFFSQLYGHA